MAEISLKRNEFIISPTKYLVDKGKPNVHAYMAMLVQPRSQGSLSSSPEKGPWLRLVTCT